MNAAFTAPVRIPRAIAKRGSKVVTFSVGYSSVTATMFTSSTVAITYRYGGPIARPPTVSCPIAARFRSPTRTACVSRWTFAKFTETRRSEEHTSELESRGHLVCRLLLENTKQETPQVYICSSGTCDETLCD